MRITLADLYILLDATSATLNIVNGVFKFDRAVRLEVINRCVNEMATVPLEVDETPAPVDPATCPCATCDEARRNALPAGDPGRFRRMVLCPVCGCKRCPHASHHIYACTGSNEPGQVGSRYAIEKDPAP